jgi:chitodextrinase
VTTPSSQNTTPPSVPSNLEVLDVTSNSATISWSASTGQVAVAGYQVFRNGSRVAIIPITSYTDEGLTSGTTYAYTVAAYDASNNVSTASSPLLVTTTGKAALPPTFVQANHHQIASGVNTPVAFNAPAQAGHTIVAYVIWSNTGEVTLSDTAGDTFVSAGAPVIWNGAFKAQVFYATSIAGGANTVNAAFQTPVSEFGVVYIHEYAGIDPVNPVDVAVSAAGTSATLDSGLATTTRPNDLLFGAGVSDYIVTAAGSGFAARDTTYGNITEDRVAVSTGAYNATATHSGNAWGMQLVAFRPAN